VTAHPVAVVYVVGMVLTALYMRLSGGLKMQVPGEEKPRDLTTIVSLLAGLVWPLWWLFYVAVKLYGVDRYQAAVAKKMGAELWWSPAPSNVRIDGQQTDYARAPPEVIRGGRRVGRWGVLLCEGFGDAPAGAPWSTVAWRPGLPEKAMPGTELRSQWIVGSHYPTFAAAKAAMTWLTEARLEELHAERWAKEQEKVVDDCLVADAAKAP
jgi:hypothetical protein